jgi:hypothetical protein
MSMWFECWRAPVASKSSIAVLTIASAITIGSLSSSISESGKWIRAEMGIDGWMGSDEEVLLTILAGRIPALCQQFRMVVVSTLFHAWFASHIASSWLML